VAASTQWRSIAVLTFAGFIASFQIGKAAIAAPLLRQDLELTILLASLIFSVYALLGAVAGLPAGILISRWNPRTTTSAGLAAIGLASLTGGLADDGNVLLATRIVEGIGFIGVVIAAPTLIRTLAAPQDRTYAMTWWSLYMPGGSATMMVAGPWLMAATGWHGLWITNGVIALAYAFVIWLALPALPAETRATPPLGETLAGVFKGPGPLLLAAGFFIYVFQYFAVTGLLPVLLVERLGLSVGQAGAIAALTVAANGLGTTAAGFAVRRGIPLWAILCVGYLTLGTTAAGVFTENAPVTLVAVLACIGLGVSGLIPSSSLAAIPRIARDTAQASVALGLLTQASALGQLLGPVALGGFVEHFGWAFAPLLFVILTVVGLTIAFVLKRLLTAQQGA